MKPELEQKNKGRQWEAQEVELRRRRKRVKIMEQKFKNQEKIIHQDIWNNRQSRLNKFSKKDPQK